jgi:hypothetical protein
MPFRYPCYRTFEKHLGRQMAILGLSEVAAGPARTNPLFP